MYMVAVIEALGVYQVSSEVTDDKRVKYGCIGRSLLSSLMGVFPVTAFGQNIGVIKLTGVKSRKPVMVAGIFS